MRAAAGLPQRVLPLAARAPEPARDAGRGAKRAQRAVPRLQPAGLRFAPLRPGSAAAEPAHKPAALRAADAGARAAGPQTAPAPNQLLPRAKPTGPDQVWVIGITYFPAEEGSLYLAAILDGWSRRMVINDTSAA